MSHPKLTRPRNGKGQFINEGRHFRRTCRICHRHYVIPACRKAVNRFCSKQCHRQFQRTLTREKANGWKGGRHINKITGYVTLLDPTHQHAYPSTGFVYEHIAVMEKHIGRRLSKHEVVHHKDGNRSNNALDNLELMSDFQHKSLHQRKNMERMKFVMPRNGRRSNGTFKKGVILWQPK